MEVDKKFTSYVLDSLKQTDSDPTECTVMVDNVEFKANKAHLMTCSDFFREVFSTDSSFIIKGIKPETYKVVNQALFTGKIALNEANMVDIWFASHYLKIKYLPEKCEDYIQQNLMKNNYLFLYSDVLNMGSDIVFDKLMSVIIEDFKRFSLINLFLELSTEMLMKVVANSKTISPDILVQSIDQWLQFDPEGPAGNYQFNLYDDLGQVRDTSDTNVVQTFVFNKEHVRKFVPSHTSHLEEKKASKFKLLQHCVRKIKLNKLSDESRKTFTHLLNQNGFIGKVFPIPTWLAKLYTEEGLENEEFNIQEKATVENVPVIVFIKDQQFTIYSLKLNEFYVLKFPVKKNIYDFYVYNNELYFSIKENNNIETFKVLRTQTAVFINVGEVDVTSLENFRYFMAYPFIYRFQLESQNLIASRFCIESENGQWSVFHKIYIERENMYDKYSFDCLFCTGNKIVFEQKQRPFYFDIQQLKFYHHDFKENRSGTKALSNCDCSFLQQCGKLYKAKDTENDLKLASKTVWEDKNIALIGAEFYDNKLFVFTDSDLTLKDIKKNLGFEVKIVKLWADSTKCFFMTVPPEWLTHKI